MTKITFVVTSYNYESYIEETLNSIKNQTFKDFEIIIVDDFSSDNSISIINHFISTNPDLNIKLLKHEKNQGQLKSIITGLKEAQGEYVCFIDSDDVLINSYAEKLLVAHSKTNVGFISSECQNMNSSGKIVENKNKPDSKLKVLTSLTAPCGGWFWNPMPSAMFKTNCVKIVTNYKNTDDWRICPDKFLFNFVNLIDNSANLNESLVLKRHHDKNAGKFNRTRLNLSNNLKIRQNLVDFINSNKNLFIEKYGKTKIKWVKLKIYFSYYYLPIQILKFLFKKLF